MKLGNYSIAGFPKLAGREKSGTIMRAIVWTRYGPPDVLRLQEVEKPIPADDEVLVKIHAATVFVGDCELRSFSFPSLLMRILIRAYMGFIRPRGTKILGQELAGEVEAVGKDVELFRAGDQVFGLTGMHFGTYAEYVCMPEKENSSGALIIPKPANMSYEQAAGVPVGGTNALHFIRKAKIQRGEKVLINGAGGSIGIYAVQLARNLGAVVTVVDSADKLDMLRSLGADHCIDYVQEDFTQNGEIYDVILDVVGKSHYSRSLKSLTPTGRYLLANTLPSVMLRALWTSKTSSRQVIFELASPKAADLVFLRQLIEQGKLKTAIDRRYPLEQTVEAHRYVDTGRKAGNVVLLVNSP